MSLFQSNVRKQIRKLPKILKFVKIYFQNYSILFNIILIQYYSILFNIIDPCPYSRGEERTGCEVRALARVELLGLGEARTSRRRPLALRARRRGRGRLQSSKIEALLGSPDAKNFEPI